jgi:anaerobic selenocysteine-containing dehydrogenase
MDDVVWPSGFQYPLYGLSQPVVEPLYDTKNSGDVMIQLAGLVGGPVASGFPWKSYEGALKARAAGLKDFGASWKELKSKGFWEKSGHGLQNLGAVFKTPTGKFEFFSSKMELAVKAFSKKSSEETVLKQLGITVSGDEAYMPHFEPSLAKEEGLSMVPYELINISSGWVPNPPYLKKTLFDHQLRKDDSFLEINPATASKAGLQEGDLVYIKSGKGTLRVKVHLFEGAMPDVVYLPLGLGHWAYDDFHQGKGANPNEIIDGPRDPVSGNRIWWKTPIEIEKV